MFNSSKFFLLKWSSFLVSEWLDLLVSIIRVTILFDPYEKKMKGGVTLILHFMQGYESASNKILLAFIVFVN